MYSSTLEVVGRTTLTTFGQLALTSTVIAAAAGGQWDVATQHFETALRQADEMPHQLEQAHVRYWYAAMLSDRDECSDHENTRPMIDQAIAGFPQMGIPRYLAFAESLKEPIAPE